MRLLLDHRAVLNRQVRAVGAVLCVHCMLVASTQSSRRWEGCIQLLATSCCPWLVSTPLQDKAGWSALMLACRGQPAATRLLLERGAAADLQNSLGYSAAHLAADFGATRQLRMLLASGASMDVTNRRVFAALCRWRGCFGGCVDSSLSLCSERCRHSHGFNA